MEFGQAHQFIAALVPWIHPREEVDVWIVESGGGDAIQIIAQHLRSFEPHNSGDWIVTLAESL